MEKNLFQEVHERLHHFTRVGTKPEVVLNCLNAEFEESFSLAEGALYMDYIDDRKVVRKHCFGKLL